MNGVINPSVSPGSSQRETKVTWTPQTIVPGSGAASAGVITEKIRMTTIKTPSHERSGIRTPPGE